MPYKNFDKAIFFAETLHTFSTYHCLKKRVWDIFYFI